ncbi:30S ribosomal protein S2 [Bifidobacterium tibiigranuli]|uniref:30S ribosomal protein S2 n=1 Tax=Bifidobacterium tibiigranuli TaxID=2172043 RepID=UPI0026E96E0C|nr:30S ribosomal protein S2 [Bifidobacterium tibiigranuli]MCI1650336.1 30S ribosomal protein S2 [Bifidobacterium tibiigranuli]MCI2185352.1 30S ribosomal protein S2 [Bifidobacterium tibiigranuli]MCI2203673.1 30S ribosomal protein S2 [Bifidobacterium tibiigranuli]
MAQITMSDMLKAGLHFGHQTRRWNPKMKQYILTQRNGIHIINLFKSLDMIDTAYDFIKTTVAHNGTVLFVGTKKQAQEAIEKQSTRVNMPYVSERWLGGMLTNFQTVSKRVTRLKELEEMDFSDVRGSGLTKKELLLLEREKDKLNKQLGGIRNMGRTPSAMFVVDISKESLAVEEAHKLGIPVVAVVDTNTDPETVDYPIPANDDAIRGIELLTSLMADAVADGLLDRSGKAAKAEGETADQPMAAWEKELLTKDAPATADAAAEAEAPAAAEAQPAAAQSAEEAVAETPAPAQA